MIIGAIIGATLQRMGKSWRRTGRFGPETERAFFLEDGQTPAALVALLANVLLTDTAPEDVVVCEVFPTLCDLGGPTERSRIEVAENLETDFSGEDGERVYANEMGKLLGEKGELGEATHGEETLENESTTGVRR